MKAKLCLPYSLEIWLTWNPSIPMRMARMRRCDAHIHRKGRQCKDHD